MPTDVVVATAGGETAAPPVRYLEWGPVIAGAIGTAAIAFVLYAFGSALGLSAVSPYPYRGLSGTTFLVVVTLYTALVQVCSYAAGGYLAGRMRSPWIDGTTSERHFRDGAHGFAVWALGLVITAVVLASGISGVLKTATEAAGAVSAGAASSAASRLSLDPADSATDLLLRPAPAAPDQAAAPTPLGQGMGGQPAHAMAGANPDRAPLVRVFATSLKEGSLAPRDRSYLAQVVSRQTGLPQADAEKRVDEAYAEAKTAEQKLRDAANEARKKTALAGFLAAATLAIACAAACIAAGLGGRDRDESNDRYWLGRSRFW